MLISDLLESFRDIHTVALTLRTDADTPGALRLIDTNNRQLVGLVKSPADFLKLMNPRITHGSDFRIKVPPQVYQDNRGLIDTIIKFGPQIEKQHRRPIKFDLQQNVKEVTGGEISRPHLYLDMDGVQADFFSQWARWHNKKFGMSHVERYKDIGSKEQREQSISELSAEGPEFIEQFFATLPTLPGGQRLVSWLKSNKIPFTVLSAPLRGMNAPSIAGKKTWLDAHNPGTSGSAIFTGDKARLAQHGGRPNVLVDDFKKYVNAWNDAGGIGLLYRDGNVNAVIDQLAKIYGINDSVKEAQDYRSPTARMKTYLVRIRLQQTGYTQHMDTTVQARNPEQARRMIRMQYNNKNVIVGQPRELR